MTALLTDRSDDVAVADLSATALLDGPLPIASAPAGDRSGLIDQAYSEYRNLCAAGVEVDPDAFCARFPAYQTSLRKLLEVHREVAENPDLLPRADHWPAIGEEFFGFHLDAELGRGAFARVFLAREAAVGNRQVVLKVSLHADDEADTLGKLRHPNVVPIHSAQYDPETGFAIVCMPFLGGTTLLPVIEALAARKTLPDRAAGLLEAAKDDRWPPDSAHAPARALRRGTYLDGVLYLGERLANALAYVHERGILHRDLKPSNVLISPNGEPVLIDFNLALDRTMAEHRLGGTLPYMPAEQLEAMSNRSGESVPADNRADIFALGVILYELLTGVHPFGPVPLKLKTSAAREFLMNRQQRGPLPLRARNRAVDPALDRLIVRCLSADPADRPATARELAAELRRLQAPIRRARRWAAAHVKTVAAAAVLFATGTAAGGAHYATLPGPAAVHAQKGDNYFRDGEYAKAINEYNASLAANDGQPDVYYAMGRAYVGLGKFSAAAGSFERVTKLAGDETDARTAASLSYCYARFGFHQGCIDWGRRAIAAGAQNVGLAELHNDVAFSLTRRQSPGDLEAAEEHATAAVRLKPGLKAAYYNRAVAKFYMVWRDPEGLSAAEALADMRMVISLNGDDGTAFMNYIAAGLCAVELSTPGNGADNPLDADGAKYVANAVAKGYSWKCLHAHKRRLQPMAKWAAPLGPIDQPEGKRVGLDESVRVLDPITD